MKTTVKKLLAFNKNNKGASLLYVMMALVFVGAVASLVLNSARKEAIDSSLHASTEMARFSATAGLTFASTLLANPEDTVPAQNITSQELIKRLYFRSQGFNENGQPLAATDSRLPLETQRWIVGSANTFHSDAPDSNFRFRVRIMNVDFRLRDVTAAAGINDSYVLVQLESEAIDRSGSRSRNSGVFQIFGYQGGIAETVTLFPSSALYLGGGMGEINTRLTVNGDTFLRGGGNLNFSGHIFDGEFRRRGAPTTEATGPALRMYGATFRGPAYFGIDSIDANNNPTNTRLFFESTPSTFLRGFASESNIDVNNPVANSPIIGNINSPADSVGVFLNANATVRGVGHWRFIGNSRLRTLSSRQYGESNWQGVWTSGNPINLFSGSTNANRPINWTGSNWAHAILPPDRTTMNLFDSLRISPNDPPSIDIDLSVIPPDIIQNHSGGRLTGAALNSLYSGAPKYNGWMVVRINTTTPFTQNDATVFNGKAVFIMSRTSNGGARLFRSGDGSVSLIVAENGVELDQFGHNSQFRGLIVKRGAGRLNLTTDGNAMTIEGAVYSVRQGTSTGTFRLEGGGTNRITINYRPEIIKQIMDELPGVITVNGTGDDSNTERIPEFALIPSTLNPRGPFTELWSRNF